MGASSPPATQEDAGTCQGASENKATALDDGPEHSYTRRFANWQANPFVQVSNSRNRRAMYAIIADSGRQFRVEEGQELDIDYREAVTTGEQLQFERVLAIGGENGLDCGQPALAGAKVTAEVLGVQQGPKIYVQKLRRRKNYRPRTGHRQLFTRVRIHKIESEQG